jgi:hypothetical protein
MRFPGKGRGQVGKAAVTQDCPPACPNCAPASAGEVGAECRSSIGPVNIQHLEPVILLTSASRRTPSSRAGGDPDALTSRMHDGRWRTGIPACAELTEFSGPGWKTTCRPACSRRRPGPSCAGSRDAGMRLITSLPQLGPRPPPGRYKAACRQALVWRTRTPFMTVDPGSRFLSHAGRRKAGSRITRSM